MPRHIEPPDRRVSGGQDPCPRAPHFRSEAVLHRDLVDTAGGRCSGRCSCGSLVSTRLVTMQKRSPVNLASGGDVWTGGYAWRNCAERQNMAAKFCTPAYFREYLSRRWAGAAPMQAACSRRSSASAIRDPTRIWPGSCHRGDVSCCCLDGEKRGIMAHSHQATESGTYGRRRLRYTVESHGPFPGPLPWRNTSSCPRRRGPCRWSTCAICQKTQRTR